MTKLLLFLLLLPIGISAQTLEVQSPLRYLALGDSYTIGESVPSAQNWPHQLRDSLALRSITTDTLRIIATTGWRTDNLLSAIQNQSLDSVNYNLVSLLIGVNNQYQGRPLSQYLAEFPRLVDSAIRYVGGDTSHVFIVSIPDYAYTPYGQSTGTQAQISMQLDTYNLAAKRYADSLHIRFFDITPISRQGLADPTLVAGDGLHPSAKQYAMWVKLILRTIDSIGGVSTSLASVATDNGISIYPNPASGYFHIACDKNIDGIIKVFDGSGKLILSEKSKGKDILLSTAGMAKGVYSIRIETAQGITTKKIAIAK